MRDLDKLPKLVGVVADPFNYEPNPVFPCKGELYTTEDVDKHFGIYGFSNVAKQEHVDEFERSMD